MKRFVNFNIQDPWNTGQSVWNNELVVDQDGIILPPGAETGQEPIETIDGNGRWLVPGFCDTYCFFGEPGLEYRETIRTGSEAALAGGFTSVCIYPNTRPPVDNLQTYEYLQSKIGGAPIDIHIVASLTKGCEGQFIAPVMSFTSVGVHLFSDGLQPVQSSLQMKRTCEYVSMYDGLVIQSPEDRTLAGQGVLNEGVQSARLGLPGVPAITESLMVHRDGEIARETGVRLHFSNLTTRAGIEAFSYQKARGANLSCGVSPFYFLLSDDHLDWYNTNFKLWPPLRSESDRLAVIEAIRSGVIDMIPSSHMPQSEIEKTTDFISAPIGAIGLETTFAASYTGLVKQGILSIGSLLERLIVNPRKRFGLKPNPLRPGEPADFVIIDPFETVTVLKDSLRSKSRNTPFLNQRFIGSVDAVFTRNRYHTFQEPAGNEYAG
ncbi:MAG: dihydroorotase [Bacteroidetes bacterium]|nr:dihydroorotase [Bacteroidota bacterium]